jgi:HEXXH motif-containing protein
MSTAYHELSQDLLTAIARGENCSDAVSVLKNSQYSKHVLLLRGVLEAGRSRGDKPAIDGYALLAEVQQHDPAAAETVIGHPSVGAWALRTLRHDRTVPGTQLAGLAAIAAAAAIRARFPAEIEVPVTEGHVFLPSLGAAVAEGLAARVRSSPAEVSSLGRRVPVKEDAPGWLPIRRVNAGSLDVLIDDVDPCRMPTADCAPRLSTANFAEWDASLQAAWALLTPESSAEVAAVLRVIVPGIAPPNGYFSSTANENFGAVAMSPQPDPYELAATLIHETQHLKLNALQDLVMLTLPDGGERYYASWRPDPRPAGALLQGTYAFFAVSSFWRNVRQQELDEDTQLQADTEFARWRAGAADGARTLLSSGQLTPAGRDFVHEIEKMLVGWLGEPVPEPALANANHANEQHASRWQANSGMAAI